MSDPTTPNMDLTLPGVAGTQNPTPGPVYANEFNDNMSVIDVHNHTAGKGLKVPTAGININADFSFNDFDVTGVQTLGLGVSTVPSSASRTLSSSKTGGSTSTDLYYTDAEGDLIQFTRNGALISASSAQGWPVLTSPTFVTYGGGTVGAGHFSFFQDGGAPRYASIWAGSYVLFAPSVSNPTHSLTLTAAPSSTYVLTLPATPPSVVSLLQMDTSGTVTPTPVNTYALNSNPSQSCATGYSNATATFTDVTNLHVTFNATIGRPVLIQCIADDSVFTGGNGPGWQAFPQSGPFSDYICGVQLIITAGGGSPTSPCGQAQFSQDGTTSGMQVGPSLLSYIFIPTATGSFSFKVQGAVISGSGLDLLATNMRLVACQLF